VGAVFMFQPANLFLLAEFLDFLGEDCIFLLVPIVFWENFTTLRYTGKKVCGRCLSIAQDSLSKGFVQATPKCRKTKKENAHLENTRRRHAQCKGHTPFDNFVREQTWKGFDAHKRSFVQCWVVQAYQEKKQAREATCEEKTERN
jgi:hypothetical protein